jgi:hypothetical protein
MSESSPAGSGFEELARAALLEVTDPRTVGPLVEEVDEGDGVVSLLFASNLPGYLGWKWTVSVAKIGDADPTVLESELVPGDGSLLAPEWLPWSDRLDQSNVTAAVDSDDENEDAEDDDDDDLVDEEDLVGGLGRDAYDGVDVDSVLDEDEDEDDDDEDEDDDEFESETDSHSESDDDFETENDFDPELEVGSSGAAAVRVDQTEDADGDPGDAGPEPAGAVGTEKTGGTEKQGDETQ